MQKTLKTSGNVFLEYLEGSVFHILSKSCRVVPLMPVIIFVDHVTKFNLNPMKHLG